EKDDLCAKAALPRHAPSPQVWDPTKSWQSSRILEALCLGRANSGANSDGREFAVGALAVRWATVTSGFRRVIDENSYFVTRISTNRPLFVRYTPMRCTPVTFMLMRCTLMRCTPVRYTPIRYTP